VIVAELGARSFYRSATPILQADDVLNHVWIPNQVRIVRDFEKAGVPPYTRKVNGQGFIMEREVSQQKANGVYRVAYVGDSFTEGTCPEGDSVPAQVQQSLHVSGYERVEVINAGTASYAPTLYYLLLKTKLLSYHPDLLVVNVDMTDVFDDALYSATLRSDANGDPVACLPGHPLRNTHRRTERGLEELTLMQRGVIWLSDRSDAVRLLLQVVSRPRQEYRSDGNEIPAAFAWCAPTRSAETQGDVRRSMEMLTRVVRLAKAHGVKVVVTAVPHLQQLQGAWSLGPMNEIAAVCAQENVPFLNPIEAFTKKLGSTPPQDIYIPGDMHFNAKGYRMWGEIQLEFLNKVGLP
jgi:lysophospholipase L1-like esterase